MTTLSSVSRVIVMDCRIGTPEAISVPKVRAKRETETICTNVPTFGRRKIILSKVALPFSEPSHDFRPK